MLTREQVEAIKKHCANNGAIEVGSKQMLELCDMALGYLAAKNVTDTLKISDPEYFTPSNAKSANQFWHKNNERTYNACQEFIKVNHD